MKIEIRYAPGGDENKRLKKVINVNRKKLRLYMPREGTKTFNGLIIAVRCLIIEIRYAP